ncbi:MAG: hypothetical protein HYV63_07630 [Candidatus Schekmanbacteria bacterium]|nr:hypothetical protein [Candidatus Schekmanbacteria bacterium]
MNLSPESRKQADRYLDEHAEQPMQLGQRLAEQIGRGTDDQIAKKVMSQLRGLQVQAMSGARFADIEDYIMGRLGRETQKESLWREQLEGTARGRCSFGDLMLERLGEIRKQAKELANQAEKQDEHFDVAIYIARSWIRRMVAAYLYWQSVPGRPCR